MKVFWLLSALIALAVGASLTLAKAWVDSGRPYLEELPRYDYCDKATDAFEDNDIAQTVELAEAGGCNEVLSRAQAQWQSTTARVSRCAEGVWQGRSRDITGATCAIVSDVFVIGDVRDLTRQSISFARGDDTDYFLAALSGVGLASTLIPQAEAGLNSLKFARRAGTVTEPLAQTVTKLARQGARSALGEVLADAGRTTRTLGLTRGTDALRYADSPDDLKALATFAENKPSPLLALQYGGKQVTTLTDDALYNAALKRGPEGLELAVKRGKRAFLAAHPLLGLTKSVYKGNALIVLLWLLRFLTWPLVLLISSIFILLGGFNLFLLLKKRSPKRRSAGLGRAAMLVALVGTVTALGLPLTWAASSAQVSEMPPKLVGHTSAVNSASFSPDGSLLASAGEDQTVIVWDTTTFDLVQRLQDHTSPVFSLAFSPDGSLLASGAEDGSVRVWETSMWNVVKVIPAYAREVRALAFSPDGSHLASSGQDRKPQPEGRLSRLTAALPGNNWDNTVKLFNTSDWSLIHTFTDNDSPVYTLAFSPTGDLLVSGAENSDLWVWRTATRETVTRLKAHDKAVNSVAFSPDGLTLASGGDDRSVLLWDVGTWQVQRTLQDQDASIYSIAFSPNGAFLASGSRDSSILIRQAGDKRILEDLENHGEAVNTIAFSPDSTTLASGSQDKTVGLHTLPGTQPDTTALADDEPPATPVKQNIPLELGVPVEGSTRTPDEVATYTFGATEGQVISFSQQSLSRRTNFKLVAPNGTVLFDENGRPNFFTANVGEVTLPQTGAYTLSVKPYGDAASWEFVVESVR